MKISIITPIFNNPFFHDSFASLQRQTINCKHIIINGSTAEKIEPEIRKIIRKSDLLISERDHGLYEAINKGIKYSQEDILGLLHSDDTFACDDTLATILSHFEKDGCDLIYGDLLYVNNDDKVIRRWTAGKFKRWKLYFGWMPPHPTVFIKRGVIEKHGLYLEDLKISADYEYMVRILSDKTIKVTYLPIIVTKMKLGGISNRSFKNVLLKMYEDYCIISKNKLLGPVTLFAKNIQKVKQFIVD